MPKSDSIKDLRKLSKIERQKRLEDLRDELLLLKSKNSMGGALDNPSRIRLVKKEIARLKTIENEEILGINQ
ncbi:MAG: 50S ribosomal protein L29 [Candidatus Lokiarchaeota archaeon]|nr:50S ribosomal protein L29 [Candidatus Lokiarchaeota archaeon]